MAAGIDKLLESFTSDINSSSVEIKVAEEKLRDLETEHEKLGETCKDVLLKYETASEQYRAELIYRNNVTEKLNNTRDLSNSVLESTKRLEETLSRVKADHLALSKAYQRSVTIIHEMKSQELQNEEKDKQIIKNLQDKLDKTTEQISEQEHNFKMNQSVKMDMSAIKNDLGSALISMDQLMAELKQLREEYKKILEAVTRRQGDFKQWYCKFKGESSEIIKEKLEKNPKEAIDIYESLKKKVSLNNQDISRIYEECNALHKSKVASEAERNDNEKIVKNLQAKLQDAEKNKLGALSKFSTVQKEKFELEAEELAKQIDDMKDDFNTLRDEVGAEGTKMTAIIETNNKLAFKALTKLHLTSAVKTAMDVQAKLEYSLQSDFELENQSAMKKEQNITQKEESVDMTVPCDFFTYTKNLIINLKSNNARLHNKAQNMRNKLEYIQEKLNRQMMPPPVVIPEPRAFENDFENEFLSDSSENAVLIPDHSEPKRARLD